MYEIYRRFICALLVGGVEDTKSADSQTAHNARMWLADEGRRLAEMVDMDTSLDRWLAALASVDGNFQFALDI